MVLLELASAYLGFAGTLFAAALAALVAVLVHLHSIQQNIRERKRETCARAIADALAWLELPYRIRRRCDDDLTTLTALVNRTHDLQERLLFHESWLRVEIPQARDAYCDLVGAVRTAVRDQIHDAWNGPPARRPSDMNLREIVEHSVDIQVVAFADRIGDYI